MQCKQNTDEEGSDDEDLPSFRQWMEEKQDPPHYSTPNVEVKCEHPTPKVQPVKPPRHRKRKAEEKLPVVAKQHKSMNHDSEVIIVEGPSSAPSTSKWGVAVVM